MTDILAVVNQKGGVGKSTTAANLAVCLARGGRRVLAVDLDHQQNLTQALGVAGNFDPAFNVATALSDPGLDVARALAPAGFQPGLDVLPATADLAHVEARLFAEPGGERYLSTLLAELPAAYDHIILDTPPNFGMLTSNAMVAAGRLIITAEADVFSLWAAAEVRDTVAKLHRHGSNPGLEILGVLLVRVDRRLVITRDVIAAMQDQGMTVLPMQIPRSVRVAESPGRGAPIASTHPGSPAAAAYGELAELVAATAGAGLKAAA